MPQSWNQWTNTGDKAGKGGQGDVFIVTDSTGRHPGRYALKRLINSKRLERFKREIAAIRGLAGHPNIIEIVDWGTARNEEYYVMPLGDGDLEAMLPHFDNDLEQCFSVIECICNGAAKAHALGIIHRDVKPENILFIEHIARLADFGLCLFQSEQRITPTWEAVGPRYYMAPELEDGRKLDVDARADVYSIGKVIYYILSGGHVYARENYFSKDRTLSAIHKDDRFDIFLPILKRCITESPIQRFPNAGELWNRFNEAVAQFLSHPRTTLKRKLRAPLVEYVKKAQEISKTLNDEEIVELLRQAHVSNVALSDNVLSELGANLREGFASALFNNIVEGNYPDDTVRRVAPLLLRAPGVVHHDRLNVDDPRQRRIVIIGLQEDKTLVQFLTDNTRFPVVSRSSDVAAAIAPYLGHLEQENREAVLLWTRNIDYPGKVDVLVNHLANHAISDNETALCVMGVCGCKSREAIERILDLADGLAPGPRLTSIAQGLTGIDKAMLDSLDTDRWKNPYVHAMLMILKG